MKYRGAIERSYPVSTTKKYQFAGEITTVKGLEVIERPLSLHTLYSILYIFLYIY